MSIEFTRADDGTPEWAAEEAAGLIGIAMIRADQQQGAKAAADILANLSNFALSTIHQNPRLRSARYGGCTEEQSK